ncbi:Cthe_2314 family HEPN domain-containing protein [Shewanella fidelis]|uniref:Cthe_2314 family HEPN domain-containing protein n=1 Tax=Shewanella fidelis TaxID=173509 RepID=A0AAW8NLJ2_9GAMM|nr:Cthe_2314 family HEPN domain-containing protein [Shewanella fidelis]MDR8523717.1 Cthe_2314 family HEPN domain-containing protein [Shewanella fidelis]MDW4810264.1 Cthe_2314 family HEPN domain-containing protein [Shewanella fidelis]MDW4814409.1 Cthe_2314 family HEPN domain-containing protein [Shewanella fidelis]MDW4818500.1 Cthe_2314 family HEPN domain-containing protein [Shewanella fidelis]MDW4823848.1 Cthe_2314 family HEPN domain-containing protein [Shewanella fidelis]
MKSDYYWWDLEDSSFKGVLYDSINTYFLHDHPYESWDEFRSADPHMAYAHLTYVRFNALEQQFVDLRVIPQMLGVENLPLQSQVQNINRYDWLKSIIDLSLFRFSSLRDIAFHFVNEVLELNLPDHKLNIKQLAKVLRDTHPDILAPLKVLEGTGTPLRQDRNNRAHKGFCNLYTDDDQMFKSAAWSEGYGSKIIGYDVIGVYDKSRDKIYSIVVNEVQEALVASIALVDEVYIYYRDRHDALAANSRSGVSAHFHQYHREKSS